MDGTKNELYSLLSLIPVTTENRREIEDIKMDIENENFAVAIEKLQKLPYMSEEESDILPVYEDEDDDIQSDEEDDEDGSEDEEDDDSDEEIDETEEVTEVSIYPEDLSNSTLEYRYIELLINNPESIVKYYILHEDCFFEDDRVLNLYKQVLFSDGEAFAPEIAKRGYNFARESEASNRLEAKLKREIDEEKLGLEDMEKIYIELRKLFVLRKNYKSIPIKNVQDQVIDICHYELYNRMSIAEVESAVEQVMITEKFKRAVLNVGLSDFLKEGDNNLTNGLDVPFPILSSVFKGFRKGETVAFAMPSNSGKSRFTINLAAYTAFVHQKKVLVISNEMSEEKMKLCLITTILNNPKIQKIHGQKLHKTEGELLEFQFRPDNPKEVKVDEHGFVIRGEKETKQAFIKRLAKISNEFKQTIAVTDWVNKQLNNAIHFINITDHTNDELKKVIMNYYYKEQIEYVFYDTLKTDTANIGNGEELKRTTTILSNLAQNFDLFICSTLQLAESSTLPVNLTVNDLAVSRTVKEVLDTLCLIKQIHNQTYDQYEYSLNEVDTEFFELKKYEDPDVRYYACVVDKNRAGAKPTVLFCLNLAYNSWEELGYLRLKQTVQEKE